MGKLQAAVIFGGQSSEHIVSCMSAVNVIEHIDRTRYDVLLVGITEDGHWIKADSLEDVSRWNNSDDPRTLAQYLGLNAEEEDVWIDVSDEALQDMLDSQKR